MSNPLVSDMQALRQRAEHQLENRTGMHTAQAYAALTPDAQQQLLHELQVHQIELEMQNDELRRTQTALDTAQARYFDFYDLAPVGYVTVSEQALILQANLTTANLLGVPRSKLINKPLSGFMPVSDADRFYLLCQLALASASVQSCELQMRQANGNMVWVSLQGIAVPGDEGQHGHSHGAERHHAAQAAPRASDPQRSRYQGHSGLGPVPNCGVGPRRYHRGSQPYVARTRPGQQRITRRNAR
jgi:PAS domain S-box-containing protein